MNDVTRQNLNNEMSRLNEKVKLLDPKSDEYAKVSKELRAYMEIANKDDEVKNRREVDKERLEAEANLEALKRGMESEKQEHEERLRAEETKRTYIQLAITGGISLLTFVGTWVANAWSQARSEYFEESGHAYTSRFAKFQLKEPNHPNVFTKK